MSSQAHSDTMVRTGVFSHQCPGENDLGVRIASQGYPLGAVAENIAAGQTSGKQVVDDWYNEQPPNDGHRRAILGSYHDVGCGVAYNSKTGFKWYWTADFGARPW